MKMIRSLLVYTLCFATPCSAANINCTNPTYKKNHPTQCMNFAGTGMLAAGGGAVILGGALALAGLAGGSGGASSATTSTYMPTLPTYTHVGGDVDAARLAAVMSDGQYRQNFNQYNDIRLAYATARGYTGAGSTIAVMDTGDDHWHGRAVAAIAGGPIAPDAKIETYKIAYNTVDFMSYAKIGEIMSQAQNADIINNSWNAGRPADSIYSREQIAALTDQGFVQAVSDAATRGAIFVWAAGNDGAAQSGALSALPRVMSELQGHFINVVAWDSATGALADFSNACGITKDYCITAPGTDLDTGSMNANGTSFAAPVVSAAVAVLREAFPYMTAPEITNLLFTTARDLGEPGVDEIYGWGMLDLERATRPVGAPLVPVSDNMMHPLRTAHVPGTIAKKIQSADLKFAYFDSFGRAFAADIRDNISVRNRGLAFDRLRGDSRMTVRAGNMEMGFSRSDFLSSDGFLKTDGKNMTTFVASTGSFSVGETEFFQRTQIGMSAPRPAPESMISEFSNIYTMTAQVGVRRGDWEFTLSAPDTIVGGDMRLRLPAGRAADGAIMFNDYTIDLASAPAMEYTMRYKNITAGFVDNPYGTDEVYIIAKTNIRF